VIYEKIIFVFYLFINLTLTAQNIQGFWQGQLKNELQKIDLQFCFSFDSSKNSYIAYLTVPQQ